MNKENDNKNNFRYHSNDNEIEGYQELVRHLISCPIPQEELLANLSLFLTRSSLGRILFLSELYKKILNVHGKIFEFGVRWGPNLSLFYSLRNLFEPYNQSREIIGFDTFEGFPSTHSNDGKDELVQKGNLNVSENYHETLDNILSSHQKLSFRPKNITHDLIKGNVIETLPEYLVNKPETLISLAYFDLDLYEPTKQCLEMIKPHICKNGIIAFDQLSLREFPGETIAFKEVFGAEDFKIIRSPLSPQQSYIIFE